MICPHCQSANPAGARFCEACGRALERACPECGQAVPPAARFCRHCGHSLRSLEAVPAPGAAAGWDPARLHQYIPKELLAKLQALGAGSAAGRVAGERRIVTILFCDVKGSTALAEKLDPEEWVEIMNGAFEQLIAPVYRYEGMLARLMGDAILAFFGAPLAHENDPERAVRAGLEIVAGMQAYRGKLRRERGLDLNVRVGLNTGLVVVGEVGSDLRVEYTAMGDAINLAARMEQTARPGTVQITGDVYKRVAPLFEFEDLGGVEVKGKSLPVPAYRVLGLRTQPGRLRGIAGWETPLIGREKEMSVLRQVAAEVGQGQGRIVCLVGEAGLGKSRLIQELRAAWQESETSSVSEASPEAGTSPAAAAWPGWAGTQSASYEAAAPYAIFRQIFRQLAGIVVGDSAQAAGEKLGALLRGTEPARFDRLLQVMEVLVTPAEAAPGPQPTESALAGEAFQRELIAAAGAVLRAGTADRPLAVALDDLHWADPASIELLLHLFGLADEAPLWFLCAFRPDRQSAAWQVKQIAERDYAHRYTEVRLAPLSAADSVALVEHLPAAADLAPRLRQSLLERAEGNPFFAEEIVRALIEAGVIVRDETGGWRAAAGADPEQVAIPASVQALLTARIDRLDEDSRRALQLASVVGRSFSYRLLQSLGDSQADLEGSLRTLQRADLIRETARQPELEYSFRHALTHEAAYNSMLIKHRRAYHRLAGEALAASKAGELDEYSTLIGHHFYLAGDERAGAYLSLAGDAAFRLYANTEAAVHYGRALEMAKRPDRPDSEALQSLYARRGRALELSARYAEALDNYVEMGSAARDLGDRAMELAALMLRATIYASPSPEHDGARAQGLSEEALALAGGLGDRAAEARILWNLLLLNEVGGRPREALAYGDRSLAIARELGLREQTAFTLNDMVSAYWTIGEVARAQAALVEARGLWREQGNLPMLADNLARATQFKLAAGDYAAVIADSDEAYGLSRSIRNDWGQANSRMMIGFAYLDTGELSKGISVLDEAIELAGRVGHTVALIVLPLALSQMHAAAGSYAAGLKSAAAALECAREKLPDWSPLPLAALARLHALKGDPAAALECCEAARGRAMDVNFRYLTGFWFPLTEAELVFGRGDYARAGILAEELIEAVHVTQYRPFLSEALLLKGRVLLARGQAAAAQEALEAARREAEALETRRMSWIILKNLSDLLAGQGHPVEAARLRSQAREIVDYISQHLDGAGRESFLGLPDVQAVLGGEPG